MSSETASSEYASVGLEKWSVNSRAHTSVSFFVKWYSNNRDLQFVDSGELYVKDVFSRNQISVLADAIENLYRAKPRFSNSSILLKNFMRNNYESFKIKDLGAVVESLYLFIGLSIKDWALFHIKNMSIFSTATCNFFKKISPNRKSCDNISISNI